MKKVSKDQSKGFVPRKRFYVEREALLVDIGNDVSDVRAVGMTADEHLRLISELQEALLRRSMYDGFMRRSTYEKP